MTRTQRVFVTGVALLAGLIMPAPAAVADGVVCTDTVSVSWGTDWETVTVTDAVVEALGCDDGTDVGLQLITDDGDLPAAPLVAQIQAERASFDLRPLDVGIEPVTGVRVLLDGAVLAAVVEITVDQRYFNRPGNEQVGHRETTTLQVPADGRYTVPGAPSRYTEVDCAEVGLLSDDDVIDEGSGPFTATASGVHRVCYLQVPGTQGGRDDDRGVPGVLDDVAVLGSRFGPDGGAAASGGVEGALALTGGGLATAAMLGGLLVLGGLGLRRVERWRRT